MGNSKTTNRTLEIILKILEIIIQSIIFSGISVLLGLLAADQPDSQLWTCFIIILPVIIAYLLRRFVTKFSIHLLFYIIFIIAYGILGNAVNEVVCGFNIILAILLVSFSSKKKSDLLKKTDMMTTPLSDYNATSEYTNIDEKKRLLSVDEDTSIFYGSIMVVAYIIAQVVNRPIVQNTQLLLFILFIVTKVLYNNLSKLNQIYVLNKYKSDFPAKQIKRVNGIIITALICAMLIGMLMFYNGEYGNIFKIIGAGGYYLLGAILKEFIFILGLFGSEGGSAQEQETTQSANSLDLSEIQEPSQPSMVIEAIIVTIFMLVVIAGIIAAIRSLVKYIKRFNKTRLENNDTVEYIDKKSNEATLKESIYIEAGNNTSSANKKVRKMFKKRILKSAGKNHPDSTQTSLELSEKMISNDRQRADAISSLYDKARYSDILVDKEDVDKMKKLLTNDGK